MANTIEVLAASDRVIIQMRTLKQVWCMGRKPDAIGIITVIFILGTAFTAAVQAMGAG